MKFPDSLAIAEEFFFQLWKETRIKMNMVGHHQIKQNRYKGYLHTVLKYTSLSFLNPNTFKINFVSISLESTTSPGN